ncbi:MAG: hypothetical protein LUQ65_07705 [Candidatus Helarchaeota archaeon]|nr:hypothetical protein [Candidatus Helarchaeota archaeon]
MKCVCWGDSIDTWGYLARHLHGTFNNRYKNTIGCDIGVLDVQLPYENVVFSVWDVSSKERFRFFRHLFFKGAQCALLFFDLTRPLLKVRSLITEIYSNIGPIPIILIGCNASDNPDQRQIDLHEVELLQTHMGPNAYYEIGITNDVFPTIFQEAAEFALAELGLTEEKRRVAYEWQQKRIENLTEILEQMGYRINENSEVEILNHHGLFSVNINYSGRVSFTPLICGTCQNESCEANAPPHRASLCIISDGQGYSNLELFDTDLLILAKILAISENALPDHVLDQIRKVEGCPHYIEEKYIEVLDDSNYPVEFEADFPEDHLELTTDTIQIAPQVAAENTYIIKNLFENLDHHEARALLRNYKIQFDEGRMPYSLFRSLRRQCEAIISG